MRAWQGTGATDYAGGYLELKAGDVTGVFAMAVLDMRRHPEGYGRFSLQRRDASGIFQGYLADYNDLGGWRFSTAAAATATDTVAHLRITPAGNIGIGTTSPARQLHVQAAGASFLRIEVRSQNSSPTHHMPSYITMKNADAPCARGRGRGRRTGRADISSSRLEL